MTDSPRNSTTRVRSAPGRIAAIAAAVLLAIIGLAVPVAAQEEPLPDESCELRSETYDPEGCFDYEVTQACGALDVQFTKNGSPYDFGFVYAEGTIVPDDFAGDGGFPATWLEDYNDGEIEVTFYIVGPESDYFVGSTFPNWWDRTGQTVTVLTDCEDDVPPPPPPPRVTTTTTTPPGTTSTTAVDSSTTTIDDGDVGGEFVQVPTSAEPAVETVTVDAGGATLPRTGAGTGGLLLVAGLVIGLGAVLRAISIRS